METPPPGSIRIDELLRTSVSLDAAGFQAQHPEPALVFMGGLLSPQTSSPENSTYKIKLPEKIKVNDTVQFGGNAGFPSLAPGASGGFAIFLAKSTRNPFANMITVGRALTNDVCLPLSGVSKLHATFTTLADQWKLTDHRATNGTFLDGKRLPTGGSAVLASGSEVWFSPDVRASFFLPAKLFAFLKLARQGMAL